MEALDRLLVAEAMSRYRVHYDNGELDQFEALSADDASFARPSPVMWSEMGAPLAAQRVKFQTAMCEAGVKSGQPGSVQAETEESRRFSRPEPADTWRERLAAR